MTVGQVPAADILAREGTFVRLETGLIALGRSRLGLSPGLLPF
jgi:hypothetical protein